MISARSQTKAVKYKQHIARKKSLPSQSKSADMIEKRSIVKILSRFVLLIVVTLVVYYCVDTVINISSLKQNNPLENARNIKLKQYESLEKTLVVFTDKDEDIISATVFVKNGSDGTMIIYFIPWWVYMADYSNNFNTQIIAHNLLYTGKTINESRKYEYVVWQIQNIAGISVDSYIIINAQAQESLVKTLGLESTVFDKARYDNTYLSKISLYSALLHEKELPSIWSGMVTNLTPEGFISRINSIKNSVDSKITVIDLNDPQYTLEKTQNDGQIIKVANVNVIDEVLQQNINTLKNREVLKEQANIEVYNGSSVDKAGARYTRLIANSGCKIVRYGNAPQDIEKSTIYITSKELYKNSLEMVEDIFVQKPEIVEGRPDFLTTGDIIVVLGQDLQNEIKWE